MADQKELLDTASASFEFRDLAEALSAVYWVSTITWVMALIMGLLAVGLQTILIAVPEIDRRNSPPR